jgi:hypothetical protein
MFLNVKYAIVSHSLVHFEERFFKKYNNFLKYKNETVTNILFFGLYDVIDFFRLKVFCKKNCTIHLLWGGTDCHTLKHHKFIVKKYPTKRIIHYAISQDIANSLKEESIPFLKVFSFSLLNRTFFSLTRLEQNYIPNKIYIYNGLNKGREEFFGKTIYEKVYQYLIKHNKFQDSQFIFSNCLQKNYNEMKYIYKECFIGIRLCAKDGNSNTVEEFKVMKKPIIHNSSDYGIQWKNEYDIIETILAQWGSVQDGSQNYAPV